LRGARRADHFGCFSIDQYFGTFLALAQIRERIPMQQAGTRRPEEALPLDTAILSNVTLSLLMWNIALRVARMLLA
jgi:hypothetical protein